MTPSRAPYSCQDTEDVVDADRTNDCYSVLQAADAGINPEVYRDFARRQIHYMLGDAGRSFVVGFGSRWPTQPHHAARWVHVFICSDPCKASG